MPGTTFYNQHAVAASNPGFSEIKCNRCHAVKKVTAFAKNQVKYLETKNKLGFNAREKAIITCIPCSPQQRTELTCHQCDRTKGLDFFPKTQRRDPDNAMCWACKEERANFEPGAEDSEVESASNSNTDSDSDDEFRLDSVVDATESMSLGGSRSGGGATYSSRGTGGVQLDRSTQAGTSSKASSTVGTSMTATPPSGLPAGFNKHAYGTPKKAEPKKFAKAEAGARHRIIYDVAERERQQVDEEGDYEVSSDSDSDSD